MTELATIDIKEMRENASQAADLLKAMSNKHRLLILCHLRDFSIFVAFFATWKSNLDLTIQPDHF